MIKFSSSGLWDVSDYGSTPNFSAGRAGEIFISIKDKEILHRLAEKVAYLSSRSSENDKRSLWHNHNTLKSYRPLVFCDPENGWNEIITEDKIKCSGSLARRWEMILRKEIFWGEKICDDKVIEPYFDIGYTFKEGDWGVHIIQHDKYLDKGGSFSLDSSVNSLKDLYKVHFPKLTIDSKLTNETYELANDTFSNILKVRKKGKWWWTLGLTILLISLRSPQKIFTDFIDNPDLVSALMEIISEGTQKRLDYLEENGFLYLNNDSYVGSGGFGYTDELPQKDYMGKVRTTDMWGFGESQETINVSPEMFERFVFLYQLPILSRFGLNCYGCCEPLRSRWHIIKKIPNLRRVSVSPFADKEKMAELLEDRYIFSLKASPTLLAVPKIDEELIRKEVKKALEITKGCIVEIIMKDNHSLGKNPDNVVHWVRIVKDEVEKMTNV